MKEEDQIQLKDVPHPICPLNVWFERDEWRIDRDKCDYSPELRMCTTACERRSRLEKKIDKVLEL